MHNFNRETDQRRIDTDSLKPFALMDIISACEINILVYLWAEI